MKKRRTLVSLFVIILLILGLNSYLFSESKGQNNFSFILTDDISMFNEECGAYFDSDWTLNIRNIYIPGYSERYWLVLEPIYAYPIIFKISNIYIDNPVGLTESTFNFDNYILSVPCVRVNNNTSFSLDFEFDYLPNSQEVGLYLTGYELIQNNSNNISSGQIKNLVLDTQGSSAFSFVSETYDIDNYDIAAEHWCTPQPALCGNYVQVNATSLNDISTIPTSGYLSDEAGYEDCANVEVNKVYINKNRDGSYTAFIITNATKIVTVGCDWTLEIQYKRIK